jgi:hypothetical protein
MESITKALELTLLDLCEIEKSEPRKEWRFSAADFAKMPVRSREEIMIERLAEKDTHRKGVALLTLRWIGEQLYERGGVEAMRAALEEAASHPKYEPTRNGMALGKPGMAARDG